MKEIHSATDTKKKELIRNFKINGAEYQNKRFRVGF